MKDFKLNNGSYFNTSLNQKHSLSKNSHSRYIAIALIFHIFFGFLFICPFGRHKTSAYYNLAIQNTVQSVKSIKLSFLKKLNKSNLQNFTNTKNTALQENANKEEKQEDNKDISNNNNLSNVSYNIGSQNNPAPIYPEFAINNKMEGLVELYVEVNNNGKVVNIKIRTSSGFTILDDVAKHTVEKWIFNINNNTTIDKHNIIVPIKFALMQ